MEPSQPIHPLWYYWSKYCPAGRLKCGGAPFYWTTILIIYIYFYISSIKCWMVFCNIWRWIYSIEFSSKNKALTIWVHNTAVPEILSMYISIKESCGFIIKTKISSVLIHFSSDYFTKLNFAILIIFHQLVYHWLGWSLCIFNQNNSLAPITNTGNLGWLLYRIFNHFRNNVYLF